MTHIVRLFLDAAIVLTWLTPASAAAQMTSRAVALDSAGSVGVVRAVLSYRLYFMRDSTPVSACKVLASLGMTSSELAAALPSRFGVLVDSPSSSCAPPRAGAVPSQNILSLGPITTEDSTATLRVFVRHGEYVHNEEFRLTRRQKLWVVRHVTLDAGAIIR